MATRFQVAIFVWIIELSNVSINKRLIPLSEPVKFNNGPPRNGRPFCVLSMLKYRFGAVVWFLEAFSRFSTNIRRIPPSPAGKIVKIFFPSH
jgi:hypothetical protein